jgi:hypothetical protein
MWLCKECSDESDDNKKTWGIYALCGVSAHHPQQTRAARRRQGTTSTTVVTATTATTVTTVTTATTIATAVIRN